MRPNPGHDGDIRRNAMMLVKTRGVDAIDFAARKVDAMAEIGDDENREFWERISDYVGRFLDDGW